MSKNILGIANGDYRSHDNAACILKNGELIAQAEEERFTRSKHAYDSLPVNAVRSCLQQAGMQINNIDAITVGWDVPNSAIEKRPPQEKLQKASIDIKRNLFGTEITDENSLPEVHFIPHHLAHAASVFYTSGFKNAAVIVIDGAGECEATTYWHVTNGEFQKLLGIDQTPHSLGFMFEGVCNYLGFNADEAGKLMGLAAYDDTKTGPFAALQLTDDGYRICFPRNIWEEIQRQYARKDNYCIMDMIRDLWIHYCQELFGRKNDFLAQNNPTKDIRCKIAMAVQRTLEKALIHSAKIIKRTTKENNLCLSGGVALNCSANGALERENIFDEIYIYPPANDAGGAIGSALYFYHNILNLKKNKPDTDELKNNPFTGPAYSAEEITAAIERYSLKYCECADDFSDIAEMITNGAIIGWFQGRMEMGPRALGGRSILADPRSTKIRDKVNEIKRRDWWRPLAPSILEGYEVDYFDPAIFSPFMLEAAIVKKDKRSIISGVTHVDNTSRYQSVRKELNPAYWNLIESFRKKTGIPLVLNTSFNDKGEPIVCSPEDAIKTFLNRPLDYLVMERFLINKS